MPPSAAPLLAPLLCVCPPGCFFHTLLRAQQLMRTWLNGAGKVLSNVAEVVAPTPKTPLEAFRNHWLSIRDFYIDQKNDVESGNIPTHLHGLVQILLTEDDGTLCSQVFFFFSRSPKPVAQSGCPTRVPVPASSTLCRTRSWRRCAHCASSTGPPECAGSFWARSTPSWATCACCSCRTCPSTSPWRISSVAWQRCKWLRRSSTRSPSSRFAFFCFLLLS